MRLLTVLIMLLSYQPSMVQVSWSYPFNDSTYRTYTCVNCFFDSIAESGNEYPEFDNPNGALVTEVTLLGDVDDGVITVVPVSTCWRIEMATDYSLLQRTWQSTQCTHVFLPLVQYGG